MAKLGEGDDRWIVAERQDGTNVNGWHWAEKDALQWSRGRLEELLRGLAVSDEAAGLAATVGAVEACEGEAFVNTRKGKVIPSYEIELKVAWSGTAPGEGGAAQEVSGKVHFPYIADENVGEKHEFKVSANGTTKADEALRALMLRRMAPLMHEKVGLFEKDMAKGGPGGAGPAPPPAAGGGGGAKKEAPQEAPKKKAPKEPTNASTGTIKMQEKFYCRPEDIFDALFNPGKVRHYTQADCTVSKAEGAEFMLFSGRVTGTNVKIEEGALVKQKWRFSDWADGVHSTVTITLSEPERGTTVVDLVQTGVPFADKFGNETVHDTVENGWKTLIWSRIRMAFGYGVGGF